MRRLLGALLGLALAVPAPSAGALEHSGAQAHPWYPGRSDAQNLRELDVLAQAGADTVRMDLPWSNLEPQAPRRRDRRFLARVDAYVDAAVARGLRPILNLHSTPCWASRASAALRRRCSGGFGDASFYAPADVRDLAAVSEFLADRYAGRLLAFEVWNEPDSPFFLRGAEGKPADADLYAPMLKAAYRAIKRAAPRLDVLAGSIDGTDSEFLQLLYDRGIAGHYDAIAFHPYNGGRPPAQPRPVGWPEDYEFAHGTARMHETMLRNGDRRPRLWMTEYGWTSCAQDDPGQVVSRCVDERTQAADLTQANTLVRTWFPFVEGMAWYEVRDSRPAPEGGCYECRFGLLRADFSPKPSLTAFRAANGPVGTRLLPGG